MKKILFFALASMILLACNSSVEKITDSASGEQSIKISQIDISGEKMHVTLTCNISGADMMFLQYGKSLPLEFIEQASELVWKNGQKEGKFTIPAKEVKYLKAIAFNANMGTVEFSSLKQKTGLTSKWRTMSTN